ncbi:MAG: phosphatase PAP2-related protein [Candidatus Gracilibacteria bacterium]|jgi:hypothetical protein
MIKKTKQKYKNCFQNEGFLASTIVAVILLLLSFVVNFYAGTYATRKESNFVTDIILSNTPVFYFDGTFIYGTIIFVIFVVLVCVLNPKIIPFTLKSLALFILVRSMFISLTHIGPFPTQLQIDDSSILRHFTFGGDLFFSAHTGLPFLMALIFWNNIIFRIIFICISVFFGVVVLLAHLHYSIDVFAAFFITYTIFHIARNWFKKDYFLIK